MKLSGVGSNSPSAQRTRRAARFYAFSGKKIIAQGFFGFKENFLTN
jgi:hypothetical protein